jgi:glutathione peroxidase
MQRQPIPLSLMTAMHPVRRHHVTSLPTIPLTLNDGTATDFGRFTGNAVPVVNSASECGFTQQHGVTFPLTAKANVRREARHPLYGELTIKKTFLPGTVTWNFEKFLVDRDGEIVGRFASAVDPASPELRQAIKAVIE